MQLCPLQNPSSLQLDIRDSCIVNLDHLSDDVFEIIIPETWFAVFAISMQSRLANVDVLFSSCIQGAISFKNITLFLLNLQCITMSAKTFPCITHMLLLK
jgi:hypothetical protein